MDRRTTFNTLLGRTNTAEKAVKKTAMLTGLSPYNGPWDYQMAAHLLRRTMYGPTNAQIKNAVQAGMSATLTQLLNPGSLPEEPVNYYLETDPNVPVGTSWVDKPYTAGVDMLVASRNRSMRAWTAMQPYEEGVSIREKMTLFWHNHFVTANINDPKFRYNYINRLRTNALGNFKSFVKEMTIDPSMLRFLNGRQNTKNAPNENYARELLELFTIGKGEQVGPGDYTTYTEDDIVEAAKLLTGWVNRNRPLGQGGDSQYTDPQTGLQRGDAVYNRHDTSDKTFSAAFDDKVITGAVDEADMWRELEDFVNMIFEQDATAKNICRKMYRYFVSPKISAEIETDIITPLSQTLIANDYKISFALKQLLTSKHFYDLDDDNATDEIIGSLLKSPLELLMHSMSFFDIKTPNYLSDADNHYNRWYRLTVGQVITTQGGMPIFAPDSVAGYPAYYQEPGYSRNWFNGSTLIARYKQAEILLTGRRVLAGGNNGGVQLATYFLEVFLDDLSPINWWFEWNNYIDTNNDDAVKIPLEALLKAILSSQEFGLM